MPYCCKCGVELDNQVTECPLCNFEMPFLRNDEFIENKRYPKAKNVYPQLVKQRVIKAYLIVVTSILSIALLNIIINFAINEEFTWSKYVLVSLLAFCGYLFFMFGFIKNYNHIITGISSITLIMLLIFDILDLRLNWFIDLGIPAVVTFWLVLLLLGHLFKITAGKNLLVYILTVFLIDVYCIILDLVVGYHILDSVKITWSFYVLIQTAPVIVLLLVFHYFVSAEIKLDLKRKLHLK